MSLYAGFIQLGAGLSVGLAGLAAGFAIGIVGDAGVRGTAQQPRLYIGMILILIFAEVLGLYGLIVALILNTRVSEAPSVRWLTTHPVHAQVNHAHGPLLWLAYIASLVADNGVVQSHDDAQMGVSKPVLALDITRDYKDYRHGRRVTHSLLAIGLVHQSGHVSADTVVVQKTLGAASGRERKVLVPQVLLGDALELSRSHGVDRGLDVLGREALARGHELATNVLGNGGGAVEAKQKRGLELRLGAPVSYTHLRAHET